MSRRRGSRPGTRSFSFSVVRRRQPVDLLEALPGQRPVPGRARLAAQDRGLVDERQRLDRPRGPDAGLETLLADGLGRALGRDADVLLHGPQVLVRRRIVAGVPIGQANDAERQALGQKNARPIGDDELGRAPADVDQEQGVLTRRELAAEGEVNQPGLFLARDHLDLDAGPLPHGLDELVGVGRLAHRARRDGADDLGAGAPGQLDEVLDRRGARLDRLRRELAGSQGLAPEAHHGLLAEEDFQRPVVLEVGDQQLDAVGPDVDRTERTHGGRIVASRRRNTVKTM